MLKTIQRLFCRCYLNKNLELIKSNNNLYEEINNLLEKNTVLNYELDNVEAQYNALITPNPPPPEWLDQTKEAYSPPVRYLNTAGKPYTVSLKQQDIYCPFKALEDLVTNESWRLLTSGTSLLPD